MGQIARASATDMLLMIGVLARVMLWPQIALWLAGTMLRR